MTPKARGTSAPILRSFYPSLDGLRACAFLAVFADHYVSFVIPWRILPWGWVGVDLFFVLSGFLITGLLYDSLDHEDYFRNFYIRRSLRIFPLYYAFWIALLLLTPVFHFQWNRFNLSSLVYAQNLLLPNALLGLHAIPTHVDFGRHLPLRIPQFVETTSLWSLCVEEHFYLLWPAVVFVLRTRRNLLTFCLVMICLSPIGRAIYLHHDPTTLPSGVLYTNSLSRFDTLLVGAALALWLRGNHPPLAVLRRYAWCALMGCPVLLATLLWNEKTAVLEGARDPIVSTLGFSLIAVASAGLLLLALQPKSALARFLQLRPLAALGRISYGMYFFHALAQPALASFASRFGRHHLIVALPILIFAGTLALATLSFHYVESPFLRLKARWAPVKGRVADPAPDTGKRFNFGEPKRHPSRSRKLKAFVDGVKEL